MKKFPIIIIVIVLFSLMGCQEDSLEISDIRFKGNILGETISLNENNLLFVDIIDLDGPFNSRSFVSMFKKGNTSYSLTFTIPKDSTSNSLLFPVQQTGQYGFEKVGSYNSSSPFQFNVAEKTGQEWTIHSTYSNNDDNKVEIFDIEFETDTTLIITGTFDCNLSILAGNGTAGNAKDVEFKTRFLIK
ncbi:hypothetical protein INQ51_02875 [Maribellus sp. CM-23]|uniref:hypothetical protein n=1 Tax=Maribellus sp. CM-23 TaxID=2781026 RepID=UPI001F1E22F8|nr:hypothetical protein [Maribellus sp. CM-23]MCE4563244.1 hypothetical protein [Maribellus sp. CM-23]